MANIHGNELGIYINKTDATLNGFNFIDGPDVVSNGPTVNDDLVDEGNWILVACATNCSLNLSNATIETACKSSTGGALDDASVRHTIAGQQTWNMSVDGLVDLGTAADGQENFNGLMDLAINRTPIYVAFSTGVEGVREYAGAGFINSIDASAGVDDFATYSCTIEGNGNLTARDASQTGIDPA